MLTDATRLRTRSRGFSLIELMITLVVIAILLVLGLPTMTDWLRDVRVRSTAEGLTAGLQSARVEAVRTNAAVRFQLTTSLDASCAVSNTGKHWVVSFCPVDGLCDTAADRNALPPSPGCEGLPLIIAKGTLEGRDAANISAPSATTCFTGLGRVSKDADRCPAGALDPAASGGNVDINVIGSSGDCVANGGDVRCQRITVSAGGQIRMCDPAVSAADDPRKC